MYLVRHNKLVPPYDNYDILSLKQLDDLATNKVSPHIQPLDQGQITDVVKHFKAQNYNIICSGSDRTQQTFSYLQPVFPVHEGPVIDHNLNEIYFSPAKLLEPGEDSPLVAVRTKLYSGILENHEGVEACDQLQERVEKIFENYSDNKAVCFTHGFLIRLMHSYAENNFNFKEALDHIGNYKAVPYLQVTEIKL